MPNRSREGLRRPLLFVDSQGGRFAALGAAVARAHGRADAEAATSSGAVELPPEVGIVLEEVGMALPPVRKLPSSGRARARDAAGEVVFLGAGPPPSPFRDAAVWPIEPFETPGELERLAAVRIARDRIERRIEQLPPPAA
jgi:hypothetical protein